MASTPARSSPSDVPPPEPAEPSGEDIPLKIVFEDDQLVVIDKPAGAGGASGRRPRHRDAGQCADRPLRRQPFGHRRGQAARHRAPARQGHHRPDGGGQDRPRPSRARRAVRRPRPHRAAGARLSRDRLGRPPRRPRAPSTSRSTGIPRAATRWRCGPAAREAITHWQVLERYQGTDGKPVASLIGLPAGNRPHPPDPGASDLAHIGHPLLGRPHLRHRLQDQGRPLPAAPAGRPGGPWKTGPACLSTGHRTPDHRREAGVPFGTTGRSCVVYAKCLPLADVPSKGS